MRPASDGRLWSARARPFKAEEMEAFYRHYAENYQPPAARRTANVSVDDITCAMDNLRPFRNSTQAAA